MFRMRLDLVAVALQRWKKTAVLDNLYLYLNCEMWKAGYKKP